MTAFGMFLFTLVFAGITWISCLVGTLLVDRNLIEIDSSENKSLGITFLIAAICTVGSFISMLYLQPYRIRGLDIYNPNEVKQEEPVAEDDSDEFQKSLSQVRFYTLNRKLDRLEGVMDRLENRVVNSPPNPGPTPPRPIVIYERREGGER